MLSVSSSRPDALCPQLAGYFDKVLVDAPCSGEVCSGAIRRPSVSGVRSMCAPVPCGRLLFWTAPPKRFAPAAFWPTPPARFPRRRTNKRFRLSSAVILIFPCAIQGFPAGGRDSSAWKKPGGFFDGRGRRPFCRSPEKSGRSLPVPASPPDQAPRQLLAEAEKVWRSVCCVPFRTGLLRPPGKAPPAALRPAFPAGKRRPSRRIPLCERKGRDGNPATACSLRRTRRISTVALTLLRVTCVWPHSCAARRSKGRRKGGGIAAFPCPVLCSVSAN